MSWLRNGCNAAVASAPFPLEVNKEALFKARNDLYAGEIKFVKDELSVMERLQLVVPDGEAEDLLKAAEGDAWECGPFAVWRQPPALTPQTPTAGMSVNAQRKQTLSGRRYSPSSRSSIFKPFIAPKLACVHLLRCTTNSTCHVVAEAAS